MRVFTLAMLVLGAGVLAALILGTGVRSIRDALAPVGWGIVPIVLFHAVPILLDVLAWRLLFRGGGPPTVALFGARWIGEAVNNLLPVLQIGGELVRVRLAAIAGVRTSDATASVLADVTLGAFTQIFFAIAGAVVLMSSYDADPAFPALVGLFLFGLGILAFYRLQRGRILPMAWRRIRRSPFVPAWVARLGDVAPLYRILDAIYADRLIVARSCLWRLAGWVAGGGEIFLSLHFLGYPARWTEAFILESLTQAGRSAAFAIPGGLGAQELSFLAIGLLLGFDPATCLALGLIRRGRDIALGVPAFAAYWFVETRRSIPRDGNGAPPHPKTEDRRPDRRRGQNHPLAVEPDRERHDDHEVVRVEPGDVRNDRGAAAHLAGVVGKPEGRDDGDAGHEPENNGACPWWVRAQTGAHCHKNEHVGCAVGKQVETMPPRRRLAALACKLAVGPVEKVGDQEDEPGRIRPIRIAAREHEARRDGRRQPQSRQVIRRHVALDQRTHERPHDQVNPGVVAHSGS